MKHDGGHRAHIAMEKTPEKRELRDCSTTTDHASASHKERLPLPTHSSTQYATPSRRALSYVLHDRNHQSAI